MRLYWILPLIALVTWFGMLIAMLACWSFQGHPIYWFMSEYQFPVYISDVGATNLQPLFISCAGFQGLFVFLSVLAERYLRYKGKLLPNTSHHQVNAIIASIVFVAISMLGILFVSIFSTRLYHHVHISMVGVFIGCAFVFAVLNISVYFSLAKDYPDVYLFRSHYGGIKRFQFSAISKLVWLVVAIVLAVCFGAYMNRGEESISSAFEWSVSFWYGVVLIIMSTDLMPVARSEKYSTKESFSETGITLTATSSRAPTHPHIA